MIDEHIACFVMISTDGSSISVSIFNWSGVEAWHAGFGVIIVRSLEPRTRHC